MNLDTFTKAYIECALWSSMDNADENTGGEPLDANYGIDDIHADTLAKMVADCQAFQATNAEHYGDADEEAGHDFWLTRNGHGCGFWDGDWQEPGASAMDAYCKRAGEVDLYIGDDGMIHA